jgi:predicted  nucleic acid-binding Zn-ribbon protein
MSKGSDARSEDTVGALGMPGVRARQMANRITALEAERSQLRRNIAELLAEFTELRDRAVLDAQTIAELRASCAQARQSRREWIRFAIGLLGDRDEVQP